MTRPTPKLALAFALAIAASTSALAANTPAEGVVSDELVHGLSCANVSVDAIYSAIAPNAFDRQRQVPTTNSQVARNVGSYGDCWSLSHWQRLALLLGRETSAEEYSPAVIADLIRGTKEQLNFASLARFGERHVVRTPLRAYSVFQMPQRADIATNVATLIDDIKAQTGRDYFADIHDYQKHVFYRASNLYYVLAPRPSDRSVADLKRVAALANARRLPMLLLRESKTYLHVVLVTKAEKVDEGTYKFDLIDPNKPGGDYSRLIAKHEGSAWRINFENGNESPEVAIFLIGEEERPLIDQALLAYYQSLCKAPGNDHR